MMKVMRFVDDKSDKFWRIETLGTDLMTNWGKTGTSGRYEIKEFTSEEECQEQADKMIEVKVKKGYQDLPDFVPDELFYFDYDNVGLHPLTSHPLFRQYFTDAIYYNSIDEAAPFGSDEGSDALWELSDLLRRRPKAELEDFPAQVLLKLHELPYRAPEGDTLELLSSLKEQQLSGRPALKQVQRTDQTIIASALGQLKVTGDLAQGLYHAARAAIIRLELLRSLEVYVKMSSTTLQQVDADLQRYAAEQKPEWT